MYFSTYAYFFVRWMHSISHQAWLLTSGPARLPALTVSLLYGVLQKPQTDSEKAARPAALLFIVHRHPTHNNLGGSVRLLLDSLLLHLMTDSVLHCTDKCHSSTRSYSLSQPVFILCCHEVTDLYSPSKPEEWPHGANSCHHHSLKELIGTVWSLWKGLLPPLSFSFRPHDLNVREPTNLILSSFLICLFI